MLYCLKDKILLDSALAKSGYTNQPGWNGANFNFVFVVIEAKSVSQLLCSLFTHIGPARSHDQKGGAAKLAAVIRALI